MGPDPENRVGDQDTGSPGRQVSSGFEVHGESEHCREFPLVFPTKCLSITPVDMSNTSGRLFGPLEDNQCEGCRLDPKKSRREIFQRIFTLGNIWGGVSRYAATPLIATLSPAHNYITKFLPWSTNATGNHLDHAEKIQNLLRRLAPLTCLIRIQAFRTHFAQSCCVSKSS